MGMRLFGNRALVWCLADIDYEMPELSSDNLVMGSGLCPWCPTVALHVLLNLGAKAALMCLDSLRLPGCARNLHDGQRYNKPLKFLAWSFGSSLSERICVSIVLSFTRAVCKFSAERQTDTLLNRS
ncbi:hypothetical protein M9H77_08846 [Catharanthus roseus]|uniref:Uncharacterized protein n=1 Tax=Catharanthus roseus TaxID=4058 RepID=A0ACC0BYY9_CATRO|nr:hypothetical protein M9H77_08846 [Catharanthus roseus]